MYDVVGMQAKAKQQGGQAGAPVQCFIAGVGPGLLTYRMKVARLLWDADFAAEFNHQVTLYSTDAAYHNHYSH
jgi:hypothetical protein